MERVLGYVFNHCESEGVVLCLLVVVVQFTIGHRSNVESLFQCLSFGWIQLKRLNNGDRKDLIKQKKGNDRVRKIGNNVTCWFIRNQKKTISGWTMLSLKVDSTMNESSVQ